MFRINGPTNPFLINIFSDDKPLSINKYFEIVDKKNNCPICRVVKSESKVENDNIVYYAVAKIESSVLNPIDPTSEIREPTFEKMKPFVMNTEPEDGFLLGEVLGTSGMKTPKKYQKLCIMQSSESMYEQVGIPFVFNYRKLSESPHIGLFGGSGSGKTVALKSILEEAMKRDIPAIILDPHLEMNFAETKSEIPAEYATDFKSKFEIFNIGSNIGIDFSDLSSDELATIMSFSGELSDAMGALIRILHTRGETYKQLVKKIDDLISAMSKRDLGHALTNEESLLMAQYGNKIAAQSTLQGLSWRLQSLNSSNIFNKNIEDAINAICKQKICVIRGAMTQLNILSGYLVEKLYLQRRKYVDSKELKVDDVDVFPPFIVAMDEAHLFCPRGDEKAPAKKILRTISQEGRKYGVFEIFATQRPSLLDMTVVSQLATKMIFRISVKEDLLSVSKETDLSEDEIKRLPYMSSGECYISSSIIGKTISTKIRVNTTELKTSFNPFDELQNMKTTTPIEDCLLTLLPITPTNVDVALQEVKKQTGELLDMAHLNKIMFELKDKGKVKIDNHFMGISFLPILTGGD